LFSSGIYSIQTVNDQIVLRGQATVENANIQGTTRIQTSWMFISAILISFHPEEFKKAGQRIEKFCYLLFPHCIDHGYQICLAIGTSQEK
jgi:hypothetical protein